MMQKPAFPQHLTESAKRKADSGAARCSVDSLNDQPWPLRDVVLKLCDAAEILLHEKNYDGHGHEEISRALKVGREWAGPPNEKLRHGGENREWPKGKRSMKTNTLQTKPEAPAELSSSGLLADALRDVLNLIDDQILVRNTDNDADMRAFLQQAGQITRVLKAAQDALKSANDPDQTPRP